MVVYWVYHFIVFGWHLDWVQPWFVCAMPWLWCCTDVIHFLEPGFNWLSRKRADVSAECRRMGGHGLQQHPLHVIHVLFSFSLASSSMDARLITGVWNGETQTCDVHSCSLLFLPCIFEHGCTSHHRESWNGETQTCDVHSCSLQERINLRFQSFHEDASSWKVYKFGQKRTNSRFYSFHGAVPMQ